MNWLRKLAKYQQDPHIDSLSRMNPRPFAKWFTQGDREYIPLEAPQEVDPDIQDFVSSENCQITDYRNGHCQCGKRVFRITKLIEQSKKRDLNELQTKLQSGELYDIERDVKRVNEYYDDLLNTFVNSPSRANKNANSLMVVISQNPYDIAYMSTNRDWTSCMELEKGAHHTDVYCEIKEGGLIAYLIRGNDKEIEKPLARIAIKRFSNRNGDSVAIPEQSVYGNEVKGFKETVQNWINSKQGTITAGYYKREGGQWSDTFPKNMLVAPSLNTDKDKQDILKWLRQEEPLIHTEWTVTDELAEYASDMYEDGEETRQDEWKFKTEEEANDFAKKMNYSYDDETVRESVGEPWTEQDENGEWVYPRFEISKHEKNFTRDMQNQAIEVILNADKGVFPIEIIEEIKGLFNEFVDKYRRSNDRDLWNKLIKKYPELFTEEDYQDMGEQRYLNYIIKLPDDSIKKQQVRQQYLNQASNFIQNPRNFYNDRLKETISHFRMSSSIPEQAHMLDSIELYFGMSFNESVITPLQLLYEKDREGTQKATPLPDDICSQLIQFCSNLKDFKVDPSIKAQLRKQSLTRIFADVVSLFYFTDTDTPNVQRFYQWLIDNGWYSDGLGQDYSNINVERLGAAIAALGENGRQFIPWAQNQLEQARNRFQEVSASFKPESYQYRKAKLLIEQFLYIIDALEKGKPSGKYRFYSARKSWLNKISTLEL